MGSLKPACFRRGGGVDIPYTQSIHDPSLAGLGPSGESRLAMGTESPVNSDPLTDSPPATAEGENHLLGSRSPKSLFSPRPWCSKDQKQHPTDNNTNINNNDSSSQHKYIH